jgi:hypothetical protein
VSGARNLSTEEFTRPLQPVAVHAVAGTDVLNQTGVLKHVQGAGNWRPKAR